MRSDTDMIALTLRGPARTSGFVNQFGRVVLFLSALVLGGCANSSTIEAVTDDYGQRIDDEADGRRTVVITPVASSEDYDVSPASYETVDVRLGISGPLGTPAELLIKGALPDACTELHGVNQTRTDNEIIVELQMRRPQGALCASVLRPYRFYLTLDGAFLQGKYTLNLNGRREQFAVR